MNAYARAERGRLRRIFGGIDNVQLELSNRCGYAAMHPRCPVEADAPPSNLPLAIVEGIFTELARIEYDGAIIFSIYNEPLTDPRLFYLLERLRRACPNAEPYMYTNSWNLDQTLLDELARFGMSRVYANTYSDSDRRRVAKLTVPCNIRMRRPSPKLDDRMKVYGARPHGLTLPCYALQRQIVVWCSGRLGLCCDDWARTVTFGSLHASRLPSLLVTQKRRAARRALAAGDRSYFPVCAGCRRKWADYPSTLGRRSQRSTPSSAATGLAT